MDAYIIWLLIAIACLIVELLSGNLVMICFSLGAAVTVLTALGDVNVYVNVIVFAIVSTLSLFFLRPIALKYLHRNKERKSNADALIGRTGKVVETIGRNDYGRVAIDGDVWKAKSENGEIIEQNSVVTVVNRESIIITVKNNFN